MERSLFVQMGGTYHQENDYFLPDLFAPELPAIGIWGQRRKQYLKKQRQAFYTALLLSGELNNHLSDIDQQAQEMFSWLFNQIARQEGVTEQVKAENQTDWVGKMNNIQNRVVEIVYTDLIYI